MWNFSFTVPSILVLFVLLAFYVQRPRLPIRKNRTFVKILFLQFLVILFDVLSSYADENYPMFPAAAVVLLNMLFFVFFLARILYFFLMTTDVLGMRTGADAKGMFVCMLVFLVSEVITISSFFTGAVFVINETGYHRGPFYDVIYFCFFFYLALSFILLIFYRKQLSRSEFFSVLAYNLILVAGNIVRILMPTYLVMNTFCLLAILVIYLAFENPDFYTTYRYAFNIRAMREVLNKWLRLGSFCIFGFGLRDFEDMQSVYGVQQMDYGILMIIEFLKKRHPELMVFYLRMGNFAIIGPEEQAWDSLQEEIGKRFMEPWKEKDAELFLRVQFARLSSKSGLNDPDQIITSIFSALNSEKELADPVHDYIDIDRDDKEIYSFAVRRALMEAVEKDAVELYLQPIVTSKERKTVAAEALARIRGKDGALISPTLFIPIAERSGQINRLGEQMLEKACAFLSSCSGDSSRIQWINVNLSPIQCMNRNLSSRFCEIITRYNVSPSLINFEITEETMVDFSILSERMTDLIGKGFHFSLDDYGSGYSNIGRVKMYPFSNIKLDMDLVHKHCENPDRLLPAIIEVFKQEGFSITAEGIETAGMADMMESIGCDYLQGFYFSKPVPAAEFGL